MNKAKQNPSDELAAEFQQEPSVDAASADKTEQSSPDEADNGNTSTPLTDVESLTEALQLAAGEVARLKEENLRALAEVENIRRRADNDVVSARKYAIEGFAKQLLEVKDSLDQAALVDLEQTADSSVVEQMQAGLSLTLKQMDNTMEKFAVREVDAQTGVKFDPTVHQAISMLPSDDVESNCIISVMQKGFVLKDRLLRPAMVVVAQK